MTISKKNKKLIYKIFVLVLLSVASYFYNEYFGYSDPISLDDIPLYVNEPYVAVNNNVPFFEDTDMTNEAFEEYSHLDSLGRCGVAYANICKELMPTEKGNLSVISNQVVGKLQNMTL